MLLVLAFLYALSQGELCMKKTLHILYFFVIDIQIASIYDSKLPTRLCYLHHLCRSDFFPEAIFVQPLISHLYVLRRLAIHDLQLATCFTVLKASL